MGSNGTVAVEANGHHVQEFGAPPAMRFADGEGFVPVGDAGYSRWGGIILDEPVAKLSGKRWYDIVRLMRYSPIIKGMLFAVEMMIRRTEWMMDPADGEGVNEDQAQEIADFVESCRFDMRTPWEDTLAQVVSFLPYGFSLFEVVFKRRLGDEGEPASAADDGRIGWDEWAPRPQDSVVKWLFGARGVEAFEQQTPSQSAPVTIPLGRCLHFRAGGYWGSPEGESVLRAAYPDWDAINKLQLIEAIGVERDLAGLPVVKIPGRLMDPVQTPDQTIYNAYKKVARDVRNGDQAGVVFPSERDDKGNEEYTLTLLTSGGARQFDTSAIVTRRATQMTMALLADFLMVGHGKTGSYALSQDKTRLFTTAISAWLDSIANVVNDQAIKPLLRLNGIDARLTPILRPGPLDEADLKATGDFVTALAPLITELNEADRVALVAHLFDVADFPAVTTTPDEMVPEPAAAAPPAVEQAKPGGGDGQDSGVAA